MESTAQRAYAILVWVTTLDTFLIIFLAQIVTFRFFFEFEEEYLNHLTVFER